MNIQAWPGIRPVAVLLLGVIFVWVALVTSMTALPEEEEASRIVSVAQNLDRGPECDGFEETAAV